MLALYTWSADIAISAYGYEHPAAVEALAVLEEVRGVRQRPPPRQKVYAKKTDSGVSYRSLHAVRWKHPGEPERLEAALEKYGYGYEGSVAKRGGRGVTDGGRGGNPAEMAAKLHQHFVKTKIF